MHVETCLFQKKEKRKKKSSDIFIFISLFIPGILWSEKPYYIRIIIRKAKELWLRKNVQKSCIYIKSFVYSLEQTGNLHCLAKYACRTQCPSESNTSWIFDSLISIIPEIPRKLTP